MNAFAGLILLVCCLSPGVARGAPTGNRLGLLSGLVWQEGTDLNDRLEVIQKFKEVSTSEKLDQRSKELAKLIGALEPGDRVCDRDNLETLFKVFLKIEEIDANIFPTEATENITDWIIAYNKNILSSCEREAYNQLEIASEDYDSRFGFRNTLDNYLESKYGATTWFRGDFSSRNAFHNAVSLFRSNNPVRAAEYLFQVQYYEHMGIRLDCDTRMIEKYANMTEEDATNLLDQYLFEPCKELVDLTRSSFSQVALIGACESIRTNSEPRRRTKWMWPARYLTCDWVLKLDKKAVATELKDNMVNLAKERNES